MDTYERSYDNHEHVNGLGPNFTSPELMKSGLGHSLSEVVRADDSLLLRTKGAWCRVILSFLSHKIFYITMRILSCEFLHQFIRKQNILVCRRMITGALTSGAMMRLSKKHSMSGRYTRKEISFKFLKFYNIVRVIHENAVTKKMLINHQGTVREWIRCKVGSLSYEFKVKGVLEHHQFLINKGYRFLAYRSVFYIMMNRTLTGYRTSTLLIMFVMPDTSYFQW